MSQKVIFALITFTNILINLDHGILPACTNELADYFNIGEKQLGFLGSVVYLGIIILGLIVGRLYQKFNSKLVCLIGLSSMVISLVLFVLCKRIELALVSRFMTGGFQVFLLVYFPVWIDKFGGDKATLWITFLQVGVPVGIFAGYAMTAVIVQKYTVLLQLIEWQYSFYIQIGLMVTTIICFLFVKQQNLDVKQAAAIKSQLDQHLLIREGTVKKKPTYFQLLYILFSNKIYLISIMTMSVTLFVSTGIQFWMTDYFTDVLHFPKQNVNIAYAIVSLTGPTLGAVAGGVFINSIGGYINPHSIYFLFLFACIGIGCGMIIPFVSNFFVITTLLWLLLFFGGAMVPGLTGMIMASVQPEIRSFGNSNSEIIKNTFGYFPSPFLYGLVNSLSSNKRAGMTLVMYWGVLAPFLLGLGSLIVMRKGKEALVLKKQFTSDQKQSTISEDIKVPQQSRPQQQAINSSTRIEEVVQQ